MTAAILQQVWAPMAGIPLPRLNTGRREEGEQAVGKAGIAAPERLDSAPACLL